MGGEVEICLQEKKNHNSLYKKYFIKLNQIKT